MRSQRIAEFRAIARLMPDGTVRMSLRVEEHSRQLVHWDRKLSNSLSGDADAGLVAGSIVDALTLAADDWWEKACRSGCLNARGTMERRRAAR